MIRRNFIIFLIVFCTKAMPIFGVSPINSATSSNNSADVTNTQNKVMYVSGQVIIKLKTDAQSVISSRKGELRQSGIPSLDAKFAHWRVSEITPVFPVHTNHQKPGSDDLARIYKISFPANQDIMAIVDEFASDPAVEYAEPDYLNKVNDTTPNDPSLKSQDYLKVVQAAKAWDISKGNKNILITIIDSGVDWNHVDLAANIYQNLGEDIDGDSVITDADLNNVDDDSNGYVDDFHGWDFYEAWDYTDEYFEPAIGEDGQTPDNDPSDFGGHGTHCAGIAAAVTNNGVGIAGMGWDCSLLPLRTGYLAKDGGIYMLNSYSYEAIVYATNLGADIISLSWGNDYYANYAQDILNYAYNNGVMIYAAAGNDFCEKIFYPAAYDNVVSVAATDIFDEIAPFSNYHSNIDISAPGVNIYSTAPNSKYVRMSGTSMSTPLVAGVAGLVKSQHPEWSNERIITQIIETADYIDDKNPDYAGFLGSGRVNAFRVLTEAPIRYVNYQINDVFTGNGNGIIDKGETVQLAISLNSIAVDMANISITASSPDPNILFVDRTSFYPLLPMGLEIINNDDPLVFTVNANTPAGSDAVIKLVIADDSGYQNTRVIRITIQPLYLNHNINNIVFTTTSFGAYGFDEYVDMQTLLGDGFRYPKDSQFRALTHGSLWVGNSPSQVSDCFYGNFLYNNYDWVTSEGGYLNIGGTDVSDQDGKAVFNDSRSEKPLGVEVTQNSYAWANAPDDDYIVMEYKIMNNSGKTLSNIYVGLCMDWSAPVNTGYMELAGWDSTNSLGYMWVEGSAYYGISMLHPEPASYRAIDRGKYIENAFLTDKTKYDFMREGFIVTNNTGKSADWSHVLSAGPYTIPAGSYETVTFAVLAGDDLTDLQSNAQAAVEKYSTLIPAGIQIVHTPLWDTENTSTPYKVNTQILPGNTQVNPDSVRLFWQLGDEEQLFSAKMTPQGNNIFMAEIPAQSETAIHYYITAFDDANRMTKLPFDAPQSTFTFFAGQDVIKPVISNVWQLPNTINPIGPYSVTATVRDNLGVDNDQVILAYWVNDADTTTVQMNRDEGTDIFRGNINFTTALPKGDRVNYFIRAFDVAASPNSAVTESYEFKIVNSMLIDDFEGPLSKWDLGDGWGIHYYGYNGDFSISDSPFSNYETSSDNCLTLLDSFNISQNSHVAVSFYYACYLGKGDTVYFEVTSDGQVWDKLLSLTGIMEEDWIQENVSLIKYTGEKGGNVRIRFRLHSNADNNVDDGIYIDDVYIFADTLVTNVQKKTELGLPKEYSLAQNYPNPFNPSTSIAYNLPKSSFTSIKVYDILGREIKTLLQCDRQAGRYKVIWDGRDNLGKPVTSGIYFYRIESGTFSQTKKMLLVH